MLKSKDHLSKKNKDLCELARQCIDMPLRLGISKHFHTCGRQ